jgi:osmotically inducible lipoprotein OsmB
VQRYNWSQSSARRTPVSVFFLQDLNYHAFKFKLSGKPNFWRVEPSIFTKDFIMTTKILLSVAAASLIALTGCGTNPTNAQIGTGVGAVAGGVVGNAVFGSTLGTVGGAAAGALIGNEVGKKK